jgi:hypothetical protein
LRIIWFRNFSGRIPLSPCPLTSSCPWYCLLPLVACVWGGGNNGKGRSFPLGDGGGGVGGCILSMWGQPWLARMVVLGLTCEVMLRGRGHVVVGWFFFFLREQ